jgi:histone deacetylase 1/2
MQLMSVGIASMKIMYRMRSLSAAYNSYDVDTNWYTDTGASDHITSNLEKLSVLDKYKGNDQIHTASGAGMEISHIGHTVVPTSSKHLHLNNVLHVPDASKNLIFVHRLAQDNSVFLEFHPDYFLIKDRATKNTILRGRSHKGLYPLPSTDPIKQAFGVVKPTFARWHSRLGHPSAPIVSRVVSRNKLTYSFESNKELVCDACQKAKSHQLPYAKSSSFSSRPLELIFSDVWGHAPDSVGEEKYYVSFIDDYSKFTWIYLLKFKSEVFEKFHEFQKHAERFFLIAKFSPYKPIGVVNIKNFIHFLKKSASVIMSLVLMLTNKTVLQNASIAT